MAGRARIGISNNLIAYRSVEEKGSSCTFFTFQILLSNGFYFSAIRQGPSKRKKVHRKKHTS